MANVSFLHFPEEEHGFFVEDVAPLPYWSHISDSGSISPRRHPVAAIDDDIFASNFVNRTSGHNGSSSTGSVFDDRKNQVNFVLDLFHQRVEQSHPLSSDEFVSETVNDSNFDVIEENRDVGVNLFDLELGLGLGLGLDVGEEDEDDYSCGGFVVSDCGDEFYIARREIGTGNVNENENEIAGSSFMVGGLRVVGIESDSEPDDGDESLGIRVHSDEEDFGVDNANDDDDDFGIPLCWDSLQLEDDNVEVNNDFEWEELDDRVDEREVLSVMADLDEEESISALPMSGPEDPGDIDRGRGSGNLEWEVLLNVNNLERNFGDNDDYIYTAEYEMMFGQFADNENDVLGRPPASKSVVERLPSVLTTKEDVINEKTLCAVCKDHIEVGEEGKQLPCSHRYHGDCILPWLGIRNTCPVCRYELPTDDPDYEQRRMRRAARAP